MTDNTFLANHARESIWSSPQQDLQAVFKPHRLTDQFGAKAEYMIGWHTFDLPNNTDKWHVYQIGNLHPALVGLIPVRHAWTSTTQQMNVQGMIIDTYTSKGLRLPSFDVFIRILGNDTMVVAIRDQGRHLTVHEETIFIRFYSNAYFESPESNEHPRLNESEYNPVIVGDWNYYGDIRTDSHPGDILCQGGRLTDRMQLHNLDVKVAHLRASGFGNVVCYYNGSVVPSFSGYYYHVGRFQVGDWAEFVFDASVTQIQYWDINQLTTFLSEKDSMNKYILMRDIEWDGEVFYKDDVDFYLVKPDGNHFSGRTYYRNVPNAVRMITHQDYSIPTQFVTAYEDIPRGMSDPMTWKVMAVFRRTGYGGKRVTHEHARLVEFFKLSPELRLAALQGLNSTVDWWTASTLEASDLPVLMGERPFTFTTEQVEDTLGYHAISELINPGFFKTEPSSISGLVQLTLPVGLRNKATIYEYNARGKLLSYRQTNGTIIYVCDNPECAFVEGRIGHGGMFQKTVFGDGPHQLDKDWDYGFYKKLLVNGKPSGDWIVADPSEYTIDSQHRAWWNINPISWVLAIRTNETFISYDIEIDARDGLSIFSIQSIEEDTSEPDNRVEDLPYGTTDIFVNGYPMIRGVDYTGSWPQFVITNIDRFDQSGLQKIHIRCSGLPDNVDGVPTEIVPTEVGFVQYDRVSRNKRYNARTGKVQRCVIRGRVFPRDEVNFAEDEAYTPNPRIKNGDPYSIEEVVNPIGNFTVRGSYEHRAEDLARDKVIEDYMSLYFDESVEPNPNPVISRYEIVSPFITKLIHDIQHGILHVPPSIAPLTPSKLADLIEDYLYLLPYDLGTLGGDWDYLLLVPHQREGAITLGVYEYSVIDLANRIYLQGRLDFSKYLKVDPAWEPIPLPPL